MLVPPGASPETFEPTPRQFIGLNEAQLVFNVGLLEFETALLDKIEDRTKIVDLSRGIVRIEGSCAHAGRNGSDHAHGVDPHVCKEPSAKRLTALIRQARKDGIGRILYQNQFPVSVVETIARDIGAECTEIDPLREDAIANIDSITDLIVRPQ